MLTFLVNCAGELLLVRAPTMECNGVVQVFSVDLENRDLETVESIGNLAIFLGDRSISVDADKLPTIEGNCIYYIGGGATPSQRGIWMHRLKDGKHEKLFKDVVHELRPLPLSLAQVLMNYMHYSWP